MVWCSSESEVLIYLFALCSLKRKEKSQEDTRADIRLDLMYLSIYQDYSPATALVRVYRQPIDFHPTVGERSQSIVHSSDVPNPLLFRAQQNFVDT